MNSFEVDFTSDGNMRVDVRSKDQHGDLVIATALALWSAVGRPLGRIQVGQLENWYVTRTQRTGSQATTQRSLSRF